MHEIKYTDISGSDDFVEYVVFDPLAYFRVTGVAPPGECRMILECPDCKGTGKYHGFTVIEDCRKCQGSGSL